MNRIDAFLAQLFAADLSDRAGRRSVIQLHDNLLRLNPTELRSLLHEPPTLSGNSVADAIAAALCEHHWTERVGGPLPKWLVDTDAVATPPFHLVRWPELTEVGQRRTNETFARRKVFIPEEALASL